MDCKYFCPILTSVNSDGTVNYEEMHQFYDRILGAGIDGILVGGSAGEFMPLPTMKSRHDNRCRKIH